MNDYNRKPSKRFRVKTTFKPQRGAIVPTTHRYFSTPTGAATHVIKMLDHPQRFQVEVYDRTLSHIHKGCLGKLGGFVTARYHVQRIAKRLYSIEIAKRFGIDPRECDLEELATDLSE